MYKHYKSKQEVFFAVAEISYLKLGDIYVVISKDEDLTYFDRLKECTYAYAQYVIENPNIYELMVNSHMVELAKTNQLVKAIDRTYGTLIELAEKSIENNQCKAPSAYSIVNTAWAVGHGLASLIINKQFPVSSDLNCIPELLNEENDSALEENDIRQTIRFTIESTFEGMKA